MKFVTPLSALLATTLMLTACTGPETSVANNARRLSAQIDRLHFDPNTRPLKADNIRKTAEFLQQFYDLGKNDRAAALTTEQAQQRVDSFSSTITGAGESTDDLQTGSVSNVFDPRTQQSKFLSHQYTAEEPEKRAMLLLDGAIRTYWDGYFGRP